METSTPKLPAFYWVVSTLALAWMLFGVLAWFMDFMTDESVVAQMSEAQRQLYASRPQWVFVVYAIAIFSGFAGAIGLLARRSWAVPAFALSLVAVIVQFGYTFLAMDAIRLLGARVALPFPIFIFAVAALLLWFATRSKKAGWFRS